MILLDKLLGATFDSAGVARIVAFPDRARDVWKVNRYVCHTTSTSRTDLAVYIGSEQQGNRIDFTKLGNDDTSEQVHPIEVNFGLPIIFVWTGGTVGKRAEITIRGEIERR